MTKDEETKVLKAQLAEAVGLLCMSNIPEIGSVWEHSGGGKYRVIQLANEHSTSDRYPLTVVYQGMPNGKVWSRPLDQWHRSMTLLGDATQPAAGEPLAWATHSQAGEGGEV